MGKTFGSTINSTLVVLALFCNFSTPPCYFVTLKYTCTLKYTLRSLRYMQVELLTDRINNKLKKSNLIHEHALNREPVPLNQKQLVNGKW